MTDPWLTILGLGEGGVDGLGRDGREALAAAKVVMGPPRHLSLIPETAATGKRIAWPVPFAEGLETLDGLQGRRVVVLASGDPFWFGAGSAIARRFPPGAWRAIPGPSTFALAAARLGWPVEATRCLGLHAAPLSRLAPHLAPGRRLVVLVRDGPAVGDLAAYLVAAGFGDSCLTVMEALGGPRERVVRTRAAEVLGPFDHPVAVAIEVAGGGPTLPLVPGRDDAVFETDGQITRAPVRAMTLAALAPRPGERLWDIGGGSGAVGIEWLMSDPSTQAATVEIRADRADRIRANADRLGVDRLSVITGAAPAVLPVGAPPDAVFLGGGLSDEMLAGLAHSAAGARLVANAVTLEGEALLTAWQARLGGELTRIELATSAPLGPKRAWRSAYPVVQLTGRL